MAERTVREGGRSPMPRLMRQQTLIAAPLKVPGNFYDRRTREGKAYHDGYRAGVAGKLLSAAARAMPMWRAYAHGHAAGAAERARAAATAAALARSRR